jgi:hypothetical protein
MKILLTLICVCIFILNCNSQCSLQRFKILNDSITFDLAIDAYSNSAFKENLYITFKLLTPFQYIPTFGVDSTELKFYKYHKVDVNKGQYKIFRYMKAEKIVTDTFIKNIYCFDYDAGEYYEFAIVKSKRQEYEFQRQFKVKIPEKILKKINHKILIVIFNSDYEEIVKYLFINNN